MENYISVLEEQLKILNSLEKKILKNQRYLGVVPEGNMRISKNHGVDQYYFHEKGSQRERYLSKKEQALIHKLAQTSYNTKMLKQIKKQQTAIQHFLKHYDPCSVEHVYEKLSPGRQNLVTPHIPTKEQRIAQWYAEHPGSQNTYAIDQGYETIRGEIVRSKSEKILADLFYQMKIPYQYEPRLELGGETKYPDFILYHVQGDKSAYLEHFGMIDIPEYAVANFRRMHLYEQSGYHLGEDVLFTFERNGRTLNVKDVKKQLRRWLMS
ncbi:hypothetical protein SAMN02910358_01105 [Lachnospiraceae bacterium XBB1006]|nr:hypothetical protein SAMN02910358_01105 [Lachnospiraceae bacterium XBB1006]